MTISPFWFGESRAVHILINHAEVNHLLFLGSLLPLPVPFPQKSQGLVEEKEQSEAICHDQDHDRHTMAVGLVLQ